MTSSSHLTPRPSHESRSSPLTPHSSPILVTGCAGFIGSHVVDRFLSEGFPVLGIDNFDPFYDPATKRRNLAQAIPHPRFTLIEADIRDPDALRRAFSLHSSPLTPHAVVHLAAKAGVRPSLEDPVGYYETNVRGTQNLLEWARTSGVRQFVFASSSSVYGVNPNVPWREDDPVLRPISPYGASKVAGELLGHVYSHLYSIRFIALRLFTVYGPRQRPDLAICKFAQRMIEGKPIPIYGDGTSRRDYAFIHDVVAGIRAAIDYSESVYEVVNLGHHRAVSLREMVRALEDALGVTARIDMQPPQPGDVPQTWADIAKASRLLGWRPEMAFEAGLVRFVRWLKEERGDSSVKERTQGLSQENTWRP